MSSLAAHSQNNTKHGVQSVKAGKRRGTSFCSVWSIFTTILPIFLPASCGKKEEPVVQKEVVRLGDT
jgi:hypothetical protein